VIRVNGAAYENKNKKSKEGTIVMKEKKCFLKTYFCCLGFANPA